MRLRDWLTEARSTPDDIRGDDQQLEPMCEGDGQ